MAAGIERSIRRLDGALDALEAVCGRLRAGGAPAQDEGGRPGLPEDIERLAAERDEALDRAEALEAANRAASHRLERAMEAVRSVLDADIGKA